jgi:hypothetical protein
MVSADPANRPLGGKAETVAIPADQAAKLGAVA